MYASGFYRKSPARVQEWMLGAMGWARVQAREGRSFRRKLAEIRGTQWLSATEMKRFQLAALRRILLLARRQVPYYRSTFQARGFDPSRLRDASELAALPVLRKADVVRCYDELTSRGHFGLKVRGRTSGTTGASLPLCQDLDAVTHEHAFIRRQLEWAGYRDRERRAWFRGDMIVPVSARRAPFWRYNAGENMLMLSSYHLSEDSCPAYLQALRSFEPVIVQAYPSSIAYLARWLWNRGDTARIPGLRAVVTSSETVTDEQREHIETVFGVRVYDWYGLAERVAAIGTCEHGRYHIIPDYGFVELLPTDDGAFEIVGTGFGNSLMPLVRYATRDTLEPVDAGESCGCGRAFPLVRRVWGRLDDLVVTPDGRHVGACLHGWIFEGIQGIAEGQIVQRHAGAVEIRVAAHGRLEDSVRRRILAQARARLGEDIGIAIIEAPQIERTRSGKLRAVVSQLMNAATA